MKSAEGNIFRFKEFAVAHSHSSMKVGVDAMLTGAWGAVEGRRGLDAGCGCGVIALMAAQRNPECVIDAIDIHGPSVVEAGNNFASSPWKERLNAVCGDILEFSTLPENQEKYDFIISNPPFFKTGIPNPETAREKARHESNFSPASLLSMALRLLKPNGTLSLVMPADRREILTQQPGLWLERYILVSNSPGKQPKRIIAVLRKNSESREAASGEIFYIRGTDGEYSKEYLDLTAPFHLFNRR